MTNQLRSGLDRVRFEGHKYPEDKQRMGILGILRIQYIQRNLTRALQKQAVLVESILWVTCAILR